MRRAPGILSIGAILLVSMLAIGFLHARVDAQDATPVAGSLQFDVRFQDTSVVRDEAAGFQPGDRIILHDLLLINGEDVGHNGGVCTITDPDGGEMFCAVTWFLPEGTISTQFLNAPNRRHGHVP
jgi:hypothetical protein